MKKSILYTFIFACLTVITVNAQQTGPYEMLVDGVKVIVHPAGNELVVIQTVIKGGVENYKADKAGIESVAIGALTDCGTANDDKNSFKNKVDKLSAYIYGNAGLDYSTFRLNCVREDLDAVWALYTDAFLRPRFDAKEFDILKQNKVTELRASEASPDENIAKLARETAFAGKSYAINPSGTAKTVEALTADMVKNYWKSLITKSRLTIVVVADLDKAEIQKKVKQLVGSLPAGKPVVAKKVTYTPTSTSFKPETKEVATNYVQGITSGPAPGSPDYNAFVLAMSIFSNKHFVEIRTKNGLSYAPGAWFNGGATSYSTISVSTTEPDKYIAVARQLIDRVKAEGFTEAELKNEKTGYLTGIYYRQETNEATANSLVSNEVIHGDWKRSIKIQEDIKKVTLAQLNAAFNRYIKNITWVYQGNPEKVNPVLFTQKETPPIPVEKKAF